jgi:ribosomal-protein-alanine N-acetyltransferase
VRIPHNYLLNLWLFLFCQTIGVLCFARPKRNGMGDSGLMFPDVFPVLHTERLVLREIETADAVAIRKMRSNHAVNRFIARPAMDDVAAAVALAGKSRQAFYLQTGIAWAGLLKAEGDIIGTCGFNRFDIPNRRAEIGGEMDTGYWGRHLALEAVAAIVGFGFERLGLHSIEARVDPDNRGAIALLRQVGFEKEGHLKACIFFNDAFRDMAIYTCFAHG